MNSRWERREGVLRAPCESLTQLHLIYIANELSHPFHPSKATIASTGNSIINLLALPATPSLPPEQAWTIHRGKDLIYLPMPFFKYNS